jgi:hypothetical protein
MADRVLVTGTKAQVATEHSHSAKKHCRTTRYIIDIDSEEGCYLYSTQLNSTQFSKVQSSVGALFLLQERK